MNKSLGQHWLIDQNSLNSIVKAADLKDSDTVLEIGPGSGNLTNLLIPKAGQVIAVEVDESLIESLNKIKADNLTVLNQDILKFDLNKLDRGYKIVANIPYYLTSNLIRQISETKNQASLAVLLVQKEIAERLSAAPGNLSVLGLTCQYFWNVEKLDLVTKDKFNPAPKVDSQIVRLTPKDALTLNKDQQKKLFRLIKIGFSSKRKTLSNNLASGYDLNKDKINQLLVGLKLNPLIRPQELSLDRWINLLQKL